ncbi:hypothetical protein [Nesterenkonia ebinurensis]|uniref:hypothetical protein n=1 Tax=Nesterenkonia ebinurensis TaxID=2608252 RepID=UPI00123C8787|nr:hypothetical protein [Nesterenkonia ebinurensis]
MTSQQSSHQAHQQPLPAGDPNPASLHGVQQQRPRPEGPMLPRAVILGISLFCGVVLGILGTLLHGSIWMIGEVDSGLVIPWGAALGLLILLLGLVWVGTTSRSLAEPTLMGTATFTVATIAYLWPGPDQLVVPYSPVAFETLPGPVIASLVWWLGCAVTTIIGMLIVKWVLVADAARSSRKPPAAGPVD